MVVDFYDFPQTDSEYDYRVHVIAHLCPYGGLHDEPDFQNCDGYRISMLVGVDEEDHENGVYQVHLHRGGGATLACLETGSRETAEALVAWLFR